MLERCPRPQSSADGTNGIDASMLAFSAYDSLSKASAYL